MNGLIFIIFTIIGILGFFAGIILCFKSYPKMKSKPDVAIWGYTLLTGILVIIASLSFIATIDTVYSNNQQFELETRPWLYVSKIEYKFYSKNPVPELITLTRASNGIECKSEEIELNETECKLKLENFSNNPSENKFSDTYVYIKNTGKTPAKIKKIKINQEEFTVDYPLFQNEIINMPIKAPLNLNLLNQELAIKGEIIYDVYSKQEINDYSITFSSLLTIRKNDITGLNRIYSLLINK